MKQMSDRKPLNISVLLVFHLVAFSSFAAEPIPPAKQTKPLTLSAWYNRLHAIVREHSQVKPKNEVEKKQYRDNLIADIDKQLGGSTFYFKTKVKDVRWKDGVLSIYTESELKPIKVRPKPTTLQAGRSQPFEVYASEAEAAAIRPGAVLQVKAQVDFRKKQVPRSNLSLKSQVLYGLTYFRLGAGYLGVFTTNAYTVSVDKVDFQPRWVKAVGKGDSPAP